MSTNPAPHENETSHFPTSLAELQLNDNQDHRALYRSIKALRTSTLSIHNRLTSILSDSYFVTSVAVRYDLPLIANERCGSWYIPPLSKVGSTYFKSTDGHHGHWDFSLRRLNLQLLPILGEHGGAIIVDSTRRGKNLPDALSKTVPIWVAVLNRVLFPEAEEWHGLQQSEEISDSEAWQIQSRLCGFVRGFESLGIESGVLATQLGRPIRIVWEVNHGTEQSYFDSVGELRKSQECCTLVLCSASHRVRGAEVSEGGYIQGAGDDSEAWSQGLTPQLFWKYKDELLSTPEEDLPELIQGYLDHEAATSTGSRPVRIAPTRNVFLGRTADVHDTNADSEFDLVIDCNSTSPITKKHLNLSCQSGKLGSKDLRLKLSEVREVYASTIKKTEHPSVLITCETGRDLSVGVAVMLLCLFYDTSGALDLELKDGRVMDKLLVKQRLAWISAVKPDVNPSRATLQAVNSLLMERPD